MKMKEVDEAIAISVDVKRYYDKLNSIHADKLEYIEKLKRKIVELKEALREKDCELVVLNELKLEYEVETIEELSQFIREKKLKDFMDK